MMFSAIYTKYIIEILLAIFAGMSAIQVFYYAFFYIRLWFIKPKPLNESSPWPAVSIILAAHNESDNLRAFLPSILEQDYPEFELIVINDRSEDDTDTVIAQLQLIYPNLRSTFIKDKGKLEHGKKLALTLGVKAAKYPILLLTDADCQVSDKQWIKQMAQHFTNAEIVLGYGPYMSLPGLLNKWIRFETLSIAMHYFSFAKAGVPYMGVGRNLAYTKSIFEKNRGVSSHAYLSSGDDDLLINQIATPQNVALSIDPSSFVYSMPETTFKFWLRQKGRHLSTFKFYKPLHQWLLFGELFSRVSFYALVFFLIPFLWQNPIFWSAFSLRFILVFVVLTLSAMRLKEKNLFSLLIVFDFLQPYVNFFVFLSHQNTKRRKW